MDFSSILNQARAVWEKARRLYPTAPEVASIDRELKAL